MGKKLRLIPPAVWFGGRSVFPKHELQTQPIEIGSVRWKKHHRVVMSEIGDPCHLFGLVGDLPVTLSIEGVYPVGHQINDVRAVGGGYLSQVALGLRPGFRSVHPFCGANALHRLDELSTGEDRLRDESWNLVSIAPEFSLGLVEDPPRTTCDIALHSVDFTGRRVVIGQLFNMGPDRSNQLHPTRTHHAYPVGTGTTWVSRVSRFESVGPAN